MSNGLNSSSQKSKSKEPALQRSKKGSAPGYVNDPPPNGNCKGKSSDNSERAGQENQASKLDVGCMPCSSYTGKDLEPGAGLSIFAEASSGVSQEVKFLDSEGDTFNASLCDPNACPAKFEHQARIDALRDSSFDKWIERSPGPFRDAQQLRGFEEGKLYNWALSENGIMKSRSSGPYDDDDIDEEGQLRARAERVDALKPEVSESIDGFARTDKYVRQANLYKKTFASVAIDTHRFLMLKFGDAVRAMLLFFTTELEQTNDQSLITYDHAERTLAIASGIIADEDFDSAAEFHDAVRSILFKSAQITPDDLPLPLRCAHLLATGLGPLFSQATYRMEGDKNPISVVSRAIVRFRPDPGFSKTYYRTIVCHHAINREGSHIQIYHPYGRSYAVVTDGEEVKKIVMVSRSCTVLTYYDTMSLCALRDKRSLIEANELIRETDSALYEMKRSNIFNAKLSLSKKPEADFFRRNETKETNND